jgi:hypothetical protein
LENNIISVEVDNIVSKSIIAFPFALGTDNKGMELLKKNRG